MTRLLCLVLLMWSALAFALQPFGLMRKGVPGALRMSALTDLHTALFNKVNAALNLKVSIPAAPLTADKWVCNAEWFDEAKGSKLTGVTKALVATADGSDEYGTLNCWMGPKYFLPHMLLTVGKNAAGQHCVTADYIPRGPNAFGADDSYLSQHYGNDVLAWYENAMSAPGAIVLPPPKSFSARLLRSPTHLSVGGLSFDDVVDISHKHVDRWLTWIGEGKESEPRQRGALNGRDDKLRVFAFRAAVAEASEKFGADVGKLVGAAITGPVAEAYVGGGG